MAGNVAAKKINMNQLSTNAMSPAFTMQGQFNPVNKGELVPGPGKYGAPNIAIKFKTVPTYGFGSSVRSNQRKWKGQPGPGAYNPRDPNDTSSKFGFGSAARIPSLKPTASPDPGAYVVATRIIKDGPMSLGAKREGKAMLAQMPGPGQYSGIGDAFDRTHPMDSSCIIGKGERPDFINTTKGPDPGTYKLPTTFGKQMCHAKSTPNFSLYSRRKAPKADSTPGPIYPHYSQFNGTT